MEDDMETEMKLRVSRVGPFIGFLGFYRAHQRYINNPNEGPTRGEVVPTTDLNPKP